MTIYDNVYKKPIDTDILMFHDHLNKKYGITNTLEKLHHLHSASAFSEALQKRYGSGSWCTQHIVDIDIDIVDASKYTLDR